MLLSELVEEYILNGQVKGFQSTTINVKINIFKRFIDQVGDMPLRSLRKAHIESYMLFKVNTQGVKPITVNNDLRQIKAMLNYAVKEELIDKNPMDRVDLMKQEKRLSKTFTDDEIMKILNGIKGKDFLSVRNKTIIMMFVETGLRNNELINIKTSDLGEDIRILGKGNKVRYVAISPILQLQLKKYLRARTTFMKGVHCDYLFPSRTKAKLLRTSLVTSLKVYTNRTIHDLRRYYAQSMLSKVGIYHLSRLLGHSDIITTQRYVNGISDSDILEKGRFNSPLSKGHK